MNSVVIPGTWDVLTSLWIHFAYREEEKEQKSLVLVEVVTECVRIQERKMTKNGFKLIWSHRRD